MIRVLAIALKDLQQQARSRSTLVLMLAAPLLITALFGFAFGGIGGGEQAISAIPVRVVNLDQGSTQAGMGKVELGRTIVDALQSDEVTDVLQVSVVADESAARAAVDSRQVSAAIIIPAEFTNSVLADDGQTHVLIYSDPAQQVGPAIVQSVVERIVGVASGARIATSVTLAELQARGAQPGPALIQLLGQTAQRYGETATRSSLISLEQDELDSQGNRGDASQRTGNMLAAVSIGMILYFMFFNGANMARTVLEEEENGTLSRLFTTPTSRGVIFAGKFLAVFVTLAVQSVILLVAGNVIFGLSWGDPLGVAVLMTAVIASAGGLGILIVSFVRTPQQAGPLIGGGLAILSMAGGNFTAAVPMPPIFDVVTRFTPNGWAMIGWSSLLRGGNVSAVLFPALVLVALGALFLAAGTLMFRRRFA